MSLVTEAEELRKTLDMVAPEIKWRYALSDQSDNLLVLGQRGDAVYSVPVNGHELEQAWGRGITAGNFAVTVSEQVIEGLDALDNYSRKTGYKGSATAGETPKSVYASKNSGVRTEGRTLMELFELDGPL